MKIFNLSITKTLPAQELIHAFKGDHFNIHIDEKNDNIQIYRHADFKQMTKKEAVVYLSDLAKECDKIAKQL